MNDIFARLGITQEEMPTTNGMVRIDTKLEMERSEMRRIRCNENLSLYVKAYEKLIEAGLDQRDAMVMAGRLI